jgi:hypothetical protein
MQKHNMKTAQEVDFMCLGNEEMYWYLRHVAYFLLFSTKFHLFCDFTFFCSNDMFISHALKFKYPIQ